MRVAIAADHRGTDVARQIQGWLEQQGHAFIAITGDCGVGENATCDYPDKAYPVATAVGEGDADRGILVCGSGIGMSIAANKVKGVRAALVCDEVGAELSRRHNDANVLCLAADLMSPRQLERVLEVWLYTEFEGGRHARRVRKISAIEAGRSPADVTDGEVEFAAAE
ncbi:ribose 5-phosphate isomerase B [Phycisphaerales bacterium AB-hyl4]|uniref:Ribose 5-phosphate isomerase B n=1 Tax=Natronomicrosphaera hydrolytica TaxID=3242702 RepID=A0ABV4UBA6_9BACT